MSDLTFGGTDIRVAGARPGGGSSGIFLDLVSGYSEHATVRGSDSIVPSVAGRVDRNRVSDVRKIVLEGYVTGTSASDWRSKTDSLMSLMNPSSNPASLAIGTGYLGVSSGKSISARVVNMVGGPIVAQRFQPWSIELESTDPDWA